ncbi:MAG: 60S ribosomal protein L31 [Desulfurococcales archaeon]|nr:60S ribosomal protein L31 [Desulfurococcales archaeon]MEB3758439.1 60S ribosomal protein L31 [Desulfurococcales archaeon]MEB3772722.1 60S ribosomal protein L31 [Desulfurococcales archaeon]MEB3786570.1 60S ribosomal protein L31 [Desulfurococcales archaeon]MEB3799284.1 60S ribosomal protein L31 [Desulfurococcales archaeon]
MADDKQSPVLERTYTISLGPLYYGRRSNRAARAARRLRLIVKRHTKADRVVITNDVNNYLWSRGIEKPPRRIRILVRVFEEGEEEEKEKVAVVFLAK